MNRFASSTWAAVALVVLLGTPAAAQINVENFAHLGFNFSAPGARSTGMGGAFIALADDATAAETNPAGLTTLLRPEISFEFKGIQYTRTVPFEAGGEFEGSEFVDQVAVPSFASIVVPIGPVSLGAFRHELVNYRSRTYGRGYAWEVEDEGEFYTTWLFPYTTDLGMRVENYGGAAAVRFGPVSVGVAGGASLLSMDLTYRRYQLQRFEPGYLANQVIVSPEDGRQTGYFVNAGVLIRPSERFSLGGVYRMRPKYEGLRLQSLNRFDVPFEETPDTVFAVSVPDAFGAGIAVRPHDLLTLSVASVYNLYSQTTESMAFTFTGSGQDSLRVEDFAADDGLDLHAGAEMLVFVGGTFLALRGGAAYMAPSAIYYTGPREATQLLWGTEAAEPALQYTAGLGTQLFGRMQIDAAASVGEKRMELMVSGVLRFGRL